MAVYLNIQTNNLRRLSKYPFASLASLLIGKYTFPSHLITSLSFQVTSGKFPLYIGSIYVLNLQVVLQVNDSTGDKKGVINLFQQGTGSVTDTEGYICGNVSFLYPLYKWCFLLLQNTRYNYTRLLSSQLPLSSLIITCMYYIGYKGLLFQGRYLQGNIILNFYNNVIPSIDKTSLRCDIWGDSIKNTVLPVELTEKYLQSVNGVNMVDGNLTIKHRTLSNARVITKPHSIVISGVKDGLGSTQ